MLYIHLKILHYIMVLVFYEGLPFLICCFWCAMLNLLSIDMHDGWWCWIYECCLIVRWKPVPCCRSDSPFSMPSTRPSPAWWMCCRLFGLLLDWWCVICGWWVGWLHRRTWPIRGVDCMMSFWSAIHKIVGWVSWARNWSSSIRFRVRARHPLAVVFRE